MAELGGRGSTESSLLVRIIGELVASAGETGYCDI